VDIASEAALKCKVPARLRPKAISTKAIR